MVRNILVVGDLGAAGNLIKNLLLLSPSTDWPLAEDRYDRIAQQYDKSATFGNWLSKEYSLRFWHEFYNVDLSDNLDWNFYQKNCKATDKPIVFLNHSALYQPEQFALFAQDLDAVFISPVTAIGLEWQIRSYCEKKSVETMHNFTFETDVENRKKQYIAEHSQEAYARLNIENMREIIRDRQERFAKTITPIPLEAFIKGDTRIAYDHLRSKINIDIAFDAVDRTLRAWRDLHWPFDQTLYWAYGNPA